MNTPPILLTSDAVARLIPAIDALAVMRELFTALGSEQAVHPAQTLTPLPGAAGDFITYWGALGTSWVFGAKLSPYIATA